MKKHEQGSESASPVRIVVVQSEGIVRNVYVNKDAAKIPFQVTYVDYDAKEDIFPDPDSLKKIDDTDKEISSGELISIFAN